MMPQCSILQGDCLEVLRTLPDESLHCCVTSPPYWGLRDYGTGTWEGGSVECDHLAPKAGGTGQASALQVSVKRVDFESGGQYREVCGKCGARRIDRQLGLEKTPEEYVAKMVEVFREVRRVLRGDGTCWVNMGDSYAGGGRGWEYCDPNGKQLTNRGVVGVVKSEIPKGLKSKDLCGIPWRLAFALQADGWYLRSDIIWHKPNPMPESVTDRPTKAHEYLFLLSKSERYFYDAEAIREPNETDGEFITEENKRGGWRPEGGKDSELVGGKIENGRKAREDGKFPRLLNPNGRNKRTVWTVPTAPYSEAHFATFPPDLIKPCILAGCPAQCCPKCGAPWERVVEKVKGTPESFNGSDFRNGKKALSAAALNAVGQQERTAEVRTIGFEAGCTCGCTETIPGTVLDPFGGSGTTGMVAMELGRNALLIELNQKYVELARKRVQVTPGFAF